MNERVTVPEAARRLGLTEGAVRQRISRGTLDSDKDDNGRVYVYVQSLNTEEHGEETDTVVSILKDQNEFLRRQLEEEREANRENRRLLAAALERIPELEAPRGGASEPRESPLTAPEEPSKGEGPVGQDDAPGARPWYRRIFGL